MDDAAEVWPALDRQMRSASDAGAELLVLPEIAYPSYLLESRERYWEADIERSAVVLDRLAGIARQYGVWVVGGFVEERGDALFNSAAVIDASGSCVGIARKQFLWDCDNEWFEPGLSSLVVDTPWGRMGTLICADLRMPEITATLVAEGAAFIVQPTAWVNAALGTRGYRNIQPEFLVQSRCLEFGVPFASCSKSGRERSRMGYVGQSMIADSQGATLAQAPFEGDATIVADIVPARGRLRHVSEQELARLRSEAACHAATSDGVTMTIDSHAGIKSVCEEVTRQGVRTGRLPAADLSSYVAARILALEGVQGVFAAGEAPDASLVRARAAENRVFVCVGDDRGISMVVDPAGVIRHSVDSASAPIVIRPSEADSKQFTPTTPIWSQRRVETYRWVVDKSRDAGGP